MSQNLFSSSIGCWLWWPRPRQATNLSLFQPPGVYKEPEIRQIISLTSAAASTTPLEDLPSPPPLLLLLDVPCLNLKSLFLCRLARVHQEDCSSCTRKSTHSQERACKCTIDFHSQVNFTSLERACKCTIDFYSQVNSLSRTCLRMHHWISLASQLHLSRTCLQVHPWLSLASPLAAEFITFGKARHYGTDLILMQSSCSCEVDTATRCHTSCCAGCPLWAGFCCLRGAVAAQLLPIGATRPVGQDALTGWDQLFPILFLAQVLCSIEQVLAIGCHLY